MCSSRNLRSINRTCSSHAPPSNSHASYGFYGFLYDWRRHEGRVPYAHMTESNSWKERTIVVVGVGQGLGAALVKRFALGGCSVAAVARNAEALDAIVTPIESETHSEAGGEIKAFPADASDPLSLGSAFSSIRAWADRRQRTNRPRRRGSSKRPHDAPGRYRRNLLDRRQPTHQCLVSRNGSAPPDGSPVWLSIRSFSYSHPLLARAHRQNEVKLRVRFTPVSLWRPTCRPLP